MAFSLIVAGGDPSGDMPEAVAELERLGVVVREAPETNRPVSLDPGVVLRRTLEAELKAAAESIARIRAIPAAAEQLSDAFDRARLRPGGGASEYIQDVSVVNARLDDVVGAAEFEILAAQPGGPRTELQLNRSILRDVEALDRGVTKRTLYLDTVRDNTVTAEHARAMSTRAGRRAEYRTRVAPFERAIIVDRRIAFVSDHIVEGAPEHAAWLVTDPAFIGYITAEFEARWDRADPWHGELRARGRQAEGVSGGIRTTPRQREIMRDLAAGRAQKATAQRLGISLRTLTGEIADLRSLFDAVSVGELTYKWALSPDRMVDDNALEDGLPAAGDTAA